MGKAYTDNYNKDNIPVMVIGSYADACFGKESLSKTADAYKCSRDDTRKRLEILPDLCHDMMLDEKGWKESAKVEMQKQLHGFQIWEGR